MCCWIVRKLEDLACSHHVLLLNNKNGLGHNDVFFKYRYRQKRSPVQWQTKRITCCSSERLCCNFCLCGELRTSGKAELRYKCKDGSSSCCSLKVYRAGIYSPLLCFFPVVLLSSVYFLPLLRKRQRCMMQSEELLLLLGFRKYGNVINVVS